MIEIFNLRNNIKIRINNMLIKNRSIIVECLESLLYDEIDLICPQFYVFTIKGVEPNEFLEELIYLANTNIDDEINIELTYKAIPDNIPEDYEYVALLSSNKVGHIKLHFYESPLVAQVSGYGLLDSKIDSVVTIKNTNELIWR